MTEAINRLKVLGQKISEDIGADIESWEVLCEELVLRCEKSALPKVLSFLKSSKDLQFYQLMDICGVDYLGEEPRFEVVYHLLSLKYNQRIRVKVRVGEDVSLASSTGIFENANWWEREVFDLYGIPFSGHPDLRRILTDYGFEGHPLRKDFPLTGYVEVKYDDDQQRVVYEPVSLPQAYRDFDFESPWEGMKTAVSSLEKEDGQSG